MTDTPTSEPSVQEQTRPLPVPSTNGLKRLAQWHDRHNGILPMEAWYDLLEVAMHMENEAKTTAGLAALESKLAAIRKALMCCPSIEYEEDPLLMIGRLGNQLAAAKAKLAEDTEALRGMLRANDDLTDKLAAAELKIQCEGAVLEMTVARLGGVVEGRPTERINFLQRIDELRAAEADRERLKRVEARAIDMLEVYDKSMWQSEWAFEIAGCLRTALARPEPTDDAKEKS